MRSRLPLILLILLIGVGLGAWHFFWDRLPPTQIPLSEAKTTAHVRQSPVADEPVDRRFQPPSGEAELREWIDQLLAGSRDFSAVVQRDETLVTDVYEMGDGRFHVKTITPSNISEGLYDHQEIAVTVEILQLNLEGEIELINRHRHQAFDGSIGIYTHYHEDSSSKLYLTVSIQDGGQFLLEGNTFEPQFIP